MSNKEEINELMCRAEKHKDDPNFRHRLTVEQIKLYNENCEDMMVAQFETINGKCICGTEKEIRHFCNVEDLRGGQIKIPVGNIDVTSGWRRMKEIAHKAMEKGYFNAENIKDDLDNLRETYYDIGGYDELVQYFVVNSELNMSAGKIASQVAHVATDISISLSKQRDSNDPIYYDCDDYEEDLRKQGNFKEWHTFNQPKIILRAKQKDLEKLIDQGWYSIRDNGRTEVPEGSLTVVGCVPEWKSIMKPIVKRFQLLL